jgi:ABC-type lipoprotein release transport system permease subunit
VTPVDYGRGYMLLSNAQTLLDKKNIVNEIVLRTEDYTQAQGYAMQIESIAATRRRAGRRATRTS